MSEVQNIEKNELDSWIQSIQSKAAEMQKEAFSIIVENEGQKELIAAASAMRKEAAALRIAVEKRRKELKDYYLKTGKMIDEAAKQIQGLINPVEEHLKNQEQFIEIQLLKKKQAIAAERSERALKAGIETISNIQFEMTEEDFEIWLIGAIEFKRRLEAEKAAEAEKAEAERAEFEKMQKEALEAKKRIEEEKKALEAEKKALEAERAEFENHSLIKQESLFQPAEAGQKERFLHLAKTIQNLPIPLPESEKAAEAVKSIKILQKRFEDFVKQKAEEL